MSYRVQAGPLRLKAFRQPVSVVHRDPFVRSVIALSDRTALT
jgi:hypothetical protein